MLLEFDEFESSSKIWVFQSDKEFQLSTSDELTLKNFVEKWDTHGKPLKATFKAFSNYFLIFIVENTGISGCSIDKLFNEIRQLGKKNEIDFFNRWNLCFLDEYNNVKIDSIENLRKDYKSGSIKPNTMFFDNTIKTKKELNELWKKPIKKLFDN